MIHRDDSLEIEQKKFKPPRYKYIGHGHAGLITVIMEDDHIVTAWHSSSDEVKQWLEKQNANI